MAKPTSNNRIQKSPGGARPVEALIHVIRGQKTMIDADLAALYGVPTKALNLAVRRNRSRFPADFMFQLVQEEMDGLRLQIETSKTEDSKMRRGGRRYLPYAFTEPGVAMLSSVLRSKRAVQMNILIVRAFIRMRELIASNKDIASRVEKLEAGHQRTKSVINALAYDIDRLGLEVKHMRALPPAPKRKIGFLAKDA